MDDSGKMSISECNKQYMYKYCHKSIGIGIANTFLPKYCYWY